MRQKHSMVRFALESLVPVDVGLTASYPIVDIGSVDENKGASNTHTDPSVYQAVPIMAVSVSVALSVAEETSQE